jgi:hypothetical protein
MYEMLALSAFHLSIKLPAKSDLYLTESTTLQAEALSMFNSSIPSVSQDNIIPTFLFSAVLGLHFFCDTFSTYGQDLNTFLDRLVQSIQLLRGVKVIIGDSWQYIINSDLRCLLETNEEVVDRDDELTHAFEDLRVKFTTSHTLSAFESKVCGEAIASLLRVYNLRIADDSGTTSSGQPDPGLVTGWPISLSEEYTELLRKRVPEALVVMAHFSVLLHSRRAFWAVGDAGKLLLGAIEKYLGDDWAEWLAVPKKLVFQH